MTRRPGTSRRSLLVGLAGGAAALIARAWGHGPTAYADDGDPLLLGQPNTASSRTSLTADVPGTSDSALQIDNMGLSGTAITATGVGIGVKGTGTTGVAGASNSANGSGVLGEDLTFSQVGRGVQGISHDGWGVYAVSDGQALRVDGRATFSRAGIVSIAFPENTATVNGVPLSTSSSFPERPSLVLATCQEEVPGVWVVATVLDPPNDSFTIVLSRPPGRKAKPQSVTVGWFVVN